MLFPSSRIDEPPASAASPALVRVRRRDGSVVVSLRMKGPVEQIVGSREVDVGSGPALLTTFLRDGLAQTNLIVPAGERSDVLDAVGASGASGAAREVGAIFNSFRSARRRCRKGRARPC